MAVRKHAQVNFIPCILSDTVSVSYIIAKQDLPDCVALGGTESDKILVVLHAWPASQLADRRKLMVNGECIFYTTCDHTVFFSLRFCYSLLLPF
jgi:hypothetical protein